MLKIPSNFQKDKCTFDWKKYIDVWKKQRLSIIKVWMFWTCENIFDLCQPLSMWTLQLLENISKHFNDPWDLSNIKKFN